MSRPTLGLITCATTIEFDAISTRGAVGLGACDLLAGDDAAGAAAVLHHDGLAEQRAHLVGEQPRHRIDAAAGREADHQPHRAVVLRGRTVLAIVLATVLGSCRIDRRRRRCRARLRKRLHDPRASAAAPTFHGPRSVTGGRQALQSGCDAGLRRTSGGADSGGAASAAVQRSSSELDLFVDRQALSQRAAGERDLLSRHVLRCDRSNRRGLARSGEQRRARRAARLSRDRRARRSMRWRGRCPSGGPCDSSTGPAPP